MRTIIFISFLLISGYSIGQNKYYTLSKNGNKFLKPVYYIYQESFEKIKNDNKNKIFLTSKNKFIYIKRKHCKYKINQQDFEKLKLLKPHELYDYEFKEYSDKANIIKKDKGFKPPAPLKHKILDVRIILFSNDEYTIYEVDWLM